MANWENNIRKVVPYTPGEQPNQPDMIKLNTNENPYPPAPGVREVLRNMDTDTLRLYPDPAALDLVRAIADTYGLSDNQVFVGSLLSLTVRNRSCFRISLILSTMYGQIFSVSRMRDRHWMSISTFAKKITSGKMAESYFRIQMHRQVW